MNERFKELCAQAGFIGESMFPVIGTCQETALQNLIELVVKECAVFASHSMDKEAMKKHFGVKE